MIEKNKKQLYDLLLRTKAINLIKSPPELNKNETDNIFRSLESDYKEIHYNLQSTQEDLKIVLDILDHNVDKAKNVNKEIYHKAIKKSYDYTQYLMLSQVHEAFIIVNQKKGEWLFCQGSVEEALDTWEKVLKVDPGNEYIYSKLTQIIANYEKE